MKNIYKLKIVTTLAAMLTISGCQAAAKYERFVDSLVCGKTSYTIVSQCETSGDKMTLNECKPQTLTSQSNGASRSVVLPELDKRTRKSIIDSGGALEDLFVVAWTCTANKGKQIAMMHYSIGGGSAPYSEAWAAYDGARLLVSSKLPFDRNDFTSINKTLKKVHSIMPE